jgi:hypothetical protein
MNLAHVLGFFAATRTEGESATTYGSPAIMCTAENIDVAYNKTPQKVFESGKVIYNRTYISDAKVTVNTRTMKLADLMNALFSLSEPAAGEVYEIGADTDKPTAYAIGWPELLDDGKYLCTWFYNATLTPPDESHKTANESGYQLDPTSHEWSCIRDPHTGLLRRMQIVDDMEGVEDFFAAVIPTSGGGT